MKQLFAYSLLIILIVINSFCSGNLANKLNNNNEKTTDSIELANIFSKGKEAFAYCTQHKMNTSFCLLANMKKHSGKFRFYVWDFAKQQVIDSGLVSHGCGNNPWSGTASKESPIFSNNDGSHCSSLGKYKIGERAYSEWGIHTKFVLNGLDNTNNNAQDRLIVLHSWDVVQDHEVFPEGTPEGWGCPAINNAFMKRIDIKLKQAKQTVLLWMFR